MAGCSAKVKCSSFLAVLTLLSIFPTTKQSSFYCVVTSRNETSQCPSNSVENDTLNNFVLNSRFNSSRSVFAFAGGTHMLKLPLIVHNLIDFTLQGLEENATVQCESLWNASISFKNTSELVIENLAFANCLSGKLVPSIYFPYKQALILFAIIFEGGANLSVSNVQFLNGAFFVNNTVGKIQIAKVDVMSNIFSEKEHESQSIGGIFFNFSICADEVSLVISETISTFTNSEGITVPYNASVDVRDRVQAMTVILYCTNVDINITRSTFVGFHGQGNGAGLSLLLQNDPHMYQKSISIHHCQFERGFAHAGGGVFIVLEALYHTLSARHSEYDIISDEEHKLEILFSNCNFTNNLAIYSGAAVQIRVSNSFTSSHLPVNISFAHCTFNGNALLRAGHGGIAIDVEEYIPLQYKLYVLPQYKITVKSSLFQHNHVNKHEFCSGNNGVISTDHTQFFMLIDTELSFNNCTAVLAIKANLLLAGQVIVSSNNGYSGGGFLFCNDAVMFLMPYTRLRISNNSVVNAGGGICVDTICLQTKPLCFFQLGHEVYKNRSLLSTITVELVDNNAKNYAGHNLFGGSVQRCYMQDTPELPSIGRGLHIFNETFKVNLSIPSSVSSIPLKVCFCLPDGTPNCTRSPHYYSPEIYPGQQVSVPVVIVGQLDGLVPGSVYASTKDDSVFPQSQTIQKVPNTTCSRLTYTICSVKSCSLQLHVHYQGDVSAFFTYDLLPTSHVYISVIDCPIGFQINEKKKVCECVHMGKNVVNMTCNITSSTVTKYDGWIGYGRDPYHIDKNATYLIHKKTCPCDYCHKQAVFRVSKDHWNQDVQCRFNRTGILCGSCSDNLSLILGSSDCWECSNVSLAWILLFALAGVALILFLSLFNFNVSEGTIGGLIFYSNVVQTGSTIFFSSDGVFVDNNMLRVFISWISLDFGIPLCLYNGMTEYSKALLQFVFPLYLWSLSGLIVLLCRRYIQVTRFLGKNSIKVLSTVLLLSFTKLARAITVALSKVTVTVNAGDLDEELKRSMWLKDANLLFLREKHLGLFIVGIIFAVPYFLFLLFLLFIQCQQCFSCVVRLKPFTDCYTGPNRSIARFWTGLLLLSRVLLVFTDSMDSRNKADVYVISTIGVAVSLLFIAKLIPGGVYVNHYHNMLESFFLLNIIFLCLGIIVTNKYVAAYHHYPVFFSCGATFIVFWGLLLYHLYCAQVRNTQFDLAVKNILARIKYKIFGKKNEEEMSVTSIHPVRQYDEDREPLLVSCNSNST